MTPPDSSRTLQLVSGILRFQAFSQPEQVKFLLNGVQPFICLQRFLNFLENLGLRIQEVLETAILVSLRSLANILGIPTRHDTHGLSHQSLPFNHGPQDFCSSG
jgi:hypothetical protein